jgi:hypothetical protein
MTNHLAFSYRLHQFVVFIAVLLAGAALCSAPLTAHAADDLGPHLKGFTRDQVLRMGEAMYRNGILPNGEPLQAVVMGDVPVEGTMFTCVSCHLRSGYGSNEGQVRMPPIDGTRLYAPVSKSRRAPLVSRPTVTVSEELYRPAYTDDTLARVIETGTDPASRQLNPVMPIYFLNEQDREIMIYYLKSLSTGHQPGVTETTLHFATVISEDVPGEDREAMLGSLQNYIKNFRLPTSIERSMRSSLYKREGTMKAMRTFTLAVWELKGPPETWREQLEGYYRKEPVFALLGGITTREWAPIHRFCEDHLIPAIFPITDYPVISETDWYTLYLSKGLYQEGEAAARYLHGKEGLSKTPSIVQVIRDEPAGLALSKGFRDTWVSLEHEAPDTVVLKRDEPISASFWKKIYGKNKHAVVLLWLNAGDFPDLKLLAKAHSRPAMVFASAGLLGNHIYTLAESERAYVYLTYPYALTQESKGLKTQTGTPPQNKTPMTRRDTALKIRTLSQTISDPLAKMRSFVSRDYFLELIESAPDLTALPAIYPRLSFGTGQRYASKGCYVVQLTEGPQPGLVKKSEWVIH